ncbi:hypothetical protein EMPS_02444 [Entomortierella parvispora]|uniref:RING-type domain-containing protein n=1 Tax=Entomortierella parvispora TaxID=205924 RepID=A0A9P3H4Q9_9FUNG|nr:hypothetical protein EMPS_02444 [Entomortierella parvispora]
MALIHTSKDEFSDLFTDFFEDLPFNVENALAIPHDPPETSRPHADASVAVSSTGQYGGTRLLNLDPQAYPKLASTVANDFYSHTRRHSDFSIESVHILRNHDIWDRYQAAKRYRRERMRKTQENRQRAREEASLRTPLAASEASLTEHEDQDQEEPEIRFRDEILFHGTQQSKISSILHNGLDPKMTIRANYGKGVYFSDSIEKCMQYTDAQTMMGQTYSIILCCVLLGKIMVEPYDKACRRLYPTSNFLPPGYDSAVAHDVFKEWVVMEKSQVLPLCVINFKTSNNPDCFYRLSQHQVLFRGTGLYPSSISDVQRVCTVPVPMDANASPDTDNVKLEEWHQPDAAFSLVLQLIYEMDVSTIKVRRLSIPGRPEWLIKVTKASAPPTHFYLQDVSRTFLMNSAKNIKTLQDRLGSDQALAAQSRAAQKSNIEKLMAEIPNCSGLLVTIQDNGAEIERIRALGQQVERDLRSLQEQATLRGMDIYHSHDFQVAAHPLRERLHQLEVQFREKLEDRASWTPEHWAQAQTILTLQKSYEEQCRMDAERDSRNKASIQSESSRTLSLSKRLLVTLTDQEMEARIKRAERECAEMGSTNPAEKFVLKEKELQTVSLHNWPQVVAELLMPTLMTSQLLSSTLLELNHTTTATNVEKKIQKLGLSHVKELWEIAPTMAFDMPMASPIFWPITAQRRLANRRLFKFKDYLEWIFLESESRSRRIQSRELAPGLIRLKSPTTAEEIEKNPLKDLDVAALLKECWDDMDPSIEPAIRDLLSRTGTVTFNRAVREAEVASMGSNLMENLYVTADAKMLAKEQSCSSSSTAPSKPECPICQDEMEVQDTQPMVSPSPSHLAPERVVKLNGCRHIFHEGCIKEWFQAKDSQLKCPMCSAMCTSKAKAGATKGAFSGKPIKLGPMPDATLGYAFDVRLACYFVYVCVPGHYITAESGSRVWIKHEFRYFVVPFTARLGPLLMIRLICLFYYGHLFMVGRSLTRNVDNVVIWNGVHVRTAMTGVYGFPAAEFEKNCWEELDRKGVAMGLETLLLDMAPAPVPLPELVRQLRDKERNLSFRGLAGSSTLGLSLSLTTSTSTSTLSPSSGRTDTTGVAYSLAADEQEEDRQRSNVNRLFRKEQHFAFRI